jgi:hypothetical protein
MDLTAWKEPIAHAVEIAGVAVILVGASAATLVFLRHVSVGFEAAYRGYRRNLGRARQSR